MATGGRGVNKAQITSLFDEAVERIFSNWTLLNLAVDQGWGGRDARQKRFQLQEEIVERLVAGAKKRRPPSHENIDDVQDLAGLVHLRIDEFFNTECDDGSPEEVSHLLLRLVNSCTAGDSSVAEETIKRLSVSPADISRCQGSEKIEYATEEDELIDGMQGMDVDGESGDEDGSGDEAGGRGPAGEAAAGAAPPAPLASAPAPPPKPAREEPEVDEDGFVSVVKGKRGGRPR